MLAADLVTNVLLGGLLLGVLAVLVLLLSGRKGGEETARGLRSEVEGLRGQLATTLAEGQAKGMESVAGRLTEAMTSFSGQVTSLNKAVESRLQNVQSSLDGKLGETARVVADVRTRLGTLAEAARNMETLGKSVTELQHILKAPKLRGNLGELFLEELLREVLPESIYELQHRFEDGTVVDAVILLREQKIPIDSKFPLESFQRMVAAADDAAAEPHRKEFVRSVKGRIDEIAKKYIRPKEGTAEFALMYIPAESVYYEIVGRRSAVAGADSLEAYARNRRVVPVSPNNFFAYLCTIVYGLKGMQVEKEAREILGRIARLQKEFGRFFETFEGIGRNLEIAQKKYEDVAKRGVRIQGQMERLTDETAALDGDGTESLPDPKTIEGGAGS